MVSVVALQLISFELCQENKENEEMQGESDSLCKPSTA